MTTEELLKPRYEVIADYPFSDCEVGKVFTEGELEDTFFNNLKKYPHIFKRLEWWEKREEKDMPEYVKHIKNNRVIKLTGYKLYPKDNHSCFYSGDLKYGVTDHIENWLPATEEEYTNYLNQ